MRVPLPIRVSFLLFALATIVLGADAMAQGGPVPWDHYKVYEANPHPTFAGPPVTLRDQFIVSDHQVMFLEKFMNPVEKRRMDTGEIALIHKPFLHYTWWRISEVPFEAVVTVENQFGPQTLNTFFSEYLLNPALKEDLSPELPVENHYKCYACQGQPVDKPVFLRDQFDDWSASVMFPRLFCNPVEKILPGAVFPRVDPDQHYVCYDFNPPDPNQFSRPVRDQFFQGPLEFFPSQLLCVPTAKLTVTSSQSSTWGKLKMLYR